MTRPLLIVGYFQGISHSGLSQAKKKRKDLAKNISIITKLAGKR